MDHPRPDVLGTESHFSDICCTPARTNFSSHIVERVTPANVLYRVRGWSDTKTMFYETGSNLCLFLVLRQSCLKPPSRGRLLQTRVIQTNIGEQLEGFVFVRGVKYSQTF